MGLTAKSTGITASNTELIIKKRNDKDKVIAIAGNPNVGKSTLFNTLTGMRQHTGNWPGKTVTNAQGYCNGATQSFVLVDIPGTYSLFAHSPEEEVARDFICFGDYESTVVVCDATCLERSLNLVLQTLEINKNVIVCINLLDEAKRKGIKINLKLLSQKLGVRVVGTVAHNKKSLSPLVKALEEKKTQKSEPVLTNIYPDIINKAIETISSALSDEIKAKINPVWLSLRLLENNESLLLKCEEYLNCRFKDNSDLISAIEIANNFLTINGVDRKKLNYLISAGFVRKSEEIAKTVTTFTNKNYSLKDRKTDKILTGKLMGYPVMILLLLFVFWLTISGTNYISEYISALFSKAETQLGFFLSSINTPIIIKRILIEGVFRVPMWVVSVMLPPMAIFFPLFTLLEDVGYLPRVAYNLDKPFKNCKSCGKQALTMCMGFGCNAAGVVGCRIIDSPRERIVAIITNSLVPCNGRFPAIISLITMFLIFSAKTNSVMLTALLLTFFILLSIGVTFFATYILSSTVLKGEPSSYILELPPYRKPRIIQVLVRSVLDRTVFVLGRSVLVAVPAGIILWLMANITVQDFSLLHHCAKFLNPFAQLLGLDGAILIAFILGFPANEIVIPIVIMIYLSNGSLTELSSLAEIRNLFVLNGWTPVTAVCTILFSLFHWPCSTTLLTVKKETGSIKWTALAALFPTALGIIICMSVNFVCKFFF